jgi:thioredoxin-like negative regulator of GroEL
LAYAQLIAGHLEDARRALERARQISPDSELVKDNLAMLLLLEGRATELLRVIDQLPSDRMRQALKAMAEFSAGFEQQSQQTLREFAASAAPDQYYNVAQVYAWRGDVRKASDWLQRSVGYQRGDAACLRGDPLMTKLYSEHQIHAVLTHNHLE